MNIGLITCNYFMRIYNYEAQEDFNWGAMSNKWKAEFKKSDFLQLAQEILDLGYNSIEIWEPTFSYTVYSEDDARQLRTELQEMGFQSFVYCIGGWGASAAEDVDAAYRFAKALGASVVTGCITKPEADVILPVIETAGKKYAMRYAIENHPSLNMESPEEIAAAIRPYETIGANLDTGIYNMMGYDVLKAMDTLNGKIYHSHFKDTVKGGDGCLPIGDGDAPMAEILKRFVAEKYTGMVSVEFEYPSDPAPGLLKSAAFISEICDLHPSKKPSE